MCTCENKKKFHLKKKLLHKFLKPIAEICSPLKERKNQVLKKGNSP